MTRPRLLLLTSDQPRHDHFVLTLAANLEPEVEVRVLRQKKSDPTLRRDGRGRRFLDSPHKGAMLRNFTLNRVFQSYYDRLFEEKKAMEWRFFAPASSELDRRRPTLVLGQYVNINDPHCVAAARDYAPHIVAVMGTSMIKSPMLEVAQTATLNLHTGLSPYYRGGMTNFFPFLNDELQYCGVTIHELDSGIDSGAVVFHGVPHIEANDDYPSINCKAIVIGARLMEAAVRAALSGTMESRPQARAGRLYLARDLNAYHAWRYYRKLAGGIVRNHLRRMQECRTCHPPDLMLYSDVEPVERHPTSAAGKPMRS